MLSISDRPCHLSNAMSTNTEKHGNEDVPAIDLGIDGVILNAADLDSLLGLGAHKAFYITPRSEELPKIRFPHLGPLKLEPKFENATVRLTVGIDGDEIGLEGCKVSGLAITLAEGGLSSLAFKVRATPESDTVGDLFVHLNSKARIEVLGASKVQAKEKKRQAGLPLGEGGDEDEAKSIAKWADRLRRLGYDVADDAALWTDAKPNELDKVMTFVEALEAGQSVGVPECLKPYAQAPAPKSDTDVGGDAA